MITVYHMRGARGLRILWTCEEMGLPYRTVPVGFNETLPEFVALNPSGTIPVMVDGETTIIESVAAIQYLAARYGPTPLAVGADEPEFADYLQFLMLGEAGLAAPMSVAVGTHFFAPEEHKANYTIGMIQDGFRRRLTLVERQLADGREFLVGGRLTLADISVTFPLGVARSLLKLEHLIPPSVEAYRKRLYERDAFKRAWAAGKPVAG